MTKRNPANVSNQEFDQAIEELTTRYRGALERLAKGVMPHESGIGPAVELVRKELTRLRERVSAYKTSWNSNRVCRVCGCEVRMASGTTEDYEWYCRNSSCEHHVGIDQGDQEPEPKWTKDA